MPRSQSQSSTLGLEERSADPDPGVVDQHVDRSELGLDRAGQLVDRARVGDVTHARARLARARATQASAVSSALRGVDVDGHHAGPARAQRSAVARPIPLPAPVMTTRAWSPAAPGSCRDRLAGSPDGSRRRAIIRMPWRGRRVNVASGSTGKPGTSS